MALVHMESFDWINQAVTGPNLQTILEKKYDESNMTTGTDATIVSGRRGGNALQFGSPSTSQGLRTQSMRDTTVDSTFICGFAIKTPPIFTVGSAWFSVMSGGQIQWSFRVELTGAITARRANSTILETSPPIFQGNRWYYVEVKSTISTTVGVIEVRIDGNIVWTSAATLNNREDTSTFWDGVKIHAGMGENTVFDDLYICDGSGSVNNDYLGDTSVEHINPNAVGDNSAWTPSSAVDHYTLVDDGDNLTVPVDETDYVSSSTTGNKDLFNYESLATGPGLGDATTIHGIQVNTWARITEIQPSDLILKTKTGTTEAGVTKTLRRDDVEEFVEIAIFEQDPDTVAAWTVSGINGAQFGIEAGSV